jgi:hypothetical protein
MKIVYEHNDEQHARHVAEHEKPQQKITATEVAHFAHIPEQSTSGAQRKAKRNR